MMYFGFFEGLPYKSATESFDSYRRMKNKIPKEKVIAYIETLDVWATSEPSYEIFTGEKMRAGLFEDGDFTFPYEFLHYYKNYDIGIPYDYEAYLRDEVGIK